MSPQYSVTSTREVATELGTGRWHLSLPDGDEPIDALLLLGHGAGGGIDAADLVALAGRLPTDRIAVARYEQPWRVAGKKVGSRPPQLDIGWVQGLAEAGGAAGLLGRPQWQGLLVSGGHSAGARVACRTAGEIDADGVLCLSFPLHPPGTPDRSRADELNSPDVPVLVLQGTKDPFGGPEEVRAQAAPGVAVSTVEGAAHALTVPARVAPVGEHFDDLAGRVRTFVAALGEAD